MPSISVVGNYPNNGKSVAMFFVEDDKGNLFNYASKFPWCYDGHIPWVSKITFSDGTIARFSSYAAGNSVWDKLQ